MDGTLIRYESTSDGTFGVLSFGRLILQTVEKPWVNNTPFHSCVPGGVYLLEPHNTPKHPNVWVLVNHDLGVYHEPHGNDRYACLIHIANYASEVQGCIGPGLDREGIMVTHSADAIAQLRSILNTRNTLAISFGVK